MKKLTKGRLWWLGPAAILLVTLFIWGHSLAPADQSSAESGRFVALLAPILEKMNLAPGKWQTVVRKAAHMTEFALLGLAWTAALAQCRAFSRLWKVGAAAAACMTAALMDETIQLPVPGRSGQISDVWVDMLGAVIGIAAGSAVTALIARRNRKRHTPPNGD